MSYLEMMKRALKERSVNATAKAWGVPQPTLDSYVKGIFVPDYIVGKKVAEEAGIPLDEAFELFAEQQAILKAKRDKKSTSFNWLLRIANVALVRVPATA